MVAKLRPAASRLNPENLMTEQPGAKSAAGADACFEASPSATPQNAAADGEAGACFEAPLRAAPQHEGVGGGPGLHGSLSMAFQQEGRAYTPPPGDSPDAAVEAAPVRRRGRRGSPLPDVDWAELRLDYEAGELTIPKLCEKYGLKTSQLRNAQERGGWVKRPRIGVAPLREGKNGPVERLAWRLRRSVVAQLVRLDARRGGGEVEADARALSELIRGWSFLAMSDRKDRQDKAGHNNKKNNDAGRHPSLEPDFLRAELKRRLDRLRDGAEPGRNDR